MSTELQSGFVATPDLAELELVNFGGFPELPPRPVVPSATYWLVESPAPGCGSASFCATPCSPLLLWPRGPVPAARSARRTR